jgi:hypothetical protein
MRNSVKAGRSIVVAAILLVTPALFAGEIHRRNDNQQQRIGEGVTTGALTARETAKLETKEASLHARTADMREDHGGRLTSKERARVNRQQNRLSRDIYRQKHDGQKR